MFCTLSTVVPHTVVLRYLLVDMVTSSGTSTTGISPALYHGMSYLYQVRVLYLYHSLSRCLEDSIQSQDTVPIMFNVVRELDLSNLRILYIEYCNPFPFLAAPTKLSGVESAGERKHQASKSFLVGSTAALKLGRSC